MKTPWDFAAGWNLIVATSKTPEPTWWPGDRVVKRDGDHYIVNHLAVRRVLLRRLAAQAHPVDVSDMRAFAQAARKVADAAAQVAFDASRVQVRIGGRVHPGFADIT